MRGRKVQSNQARGYSLSQVKEKKLRRSAQWSLSLSILLDFPDRDRCSSYISISHSLGHDFLTLASLAVMRRLQSTLSTLFSELAFFRHTPLTPIRDFSSTHPASQNSHCRGFESEVGCSSGEEDGEQNIFGDFAPQSSSPSLRFTR